MTARAGSLSWLLSAFALVACGTETVVAVSGPVPSAPPATIDGSAVPSALHTDGAKIVDAAGQEVRLTGVSWFGLETPNHAPHGLWTRSMTSVLDQIVSLGFNSLRIPFSSELLDPTSKPDSIDYTANPDLVGLGGFDLLDKLVKEASARGLAVVLDRHRPDSGGQSALWYTDAYPEERWIDDWKLLAALYRDNPHVVAFDLHNDVHDPATWGDGNAATDWRAAATRAGNAILAVDPNVLVIVEGIETSGGQAYWWGGNLRAAGASPVELTIPNHVVYGTDDYPPSVADHPWFHDATYPKNLPALWHDTWGYLVDENVAPVYLTGFGSRLATDSDQQWMTTLTSYLGQKRVSFAYWSLNPDSGDTGGVLEDDWNTVRQDVMTAVTPLLAK